MGLRLKPLPMLVDAFLGTEAFERVAMPHEAELAVTVGAKVVHAFSRELSRLRRRPGNNATQHVMLQCTISIRRKNIFQFCPST
jgi:hypothetical protein